MLSLVIFEISGVAEEKFESEPSPIKPWKFKVAGASKSLDYKEE
jgi:hypothetical protein